MLAILFSKPLFPWWLFSAAVAMALTLWGGVYLRQLDQRLAPMDDETKTEELHKLRWLFLFGTLGQFLLLVVFAGDLERDDRKFGEYFFAIIMAAYFYQYILQARIERRIRNVQVSQSSALGMFARSIIVGAGSYAIYFGVYEICRWALDFLATRFGITSFGSTLAAAAISIFVSLGFLFLMSPLLVRMMMPCKPVTDPKIVSLLESCFKKAGLAAPTFWTLELDRYRSYNAMVAGVSWGFGPFRPALIFSRALLQYLTPEEFQAIMLHEVSHLALGHMRRRIFMGVVVALFALMPYLLLMTAILYVVPNDVRPIAITLLVIGYLVLQIGLVQYQVRLQELEADAHAVLNLGASLEAFEKGLIKLHQMNHAPLDRKDPNSVLCAACGHPVALKRIAAVRSKLARVQAGEKLDLRWLWLSDAFRAHGRKLAGAGLAVFVAAFLSYAAFIAPVHRLSVAVVNNDVESARKYATPSVVNSTDFLNWGFTPLMAAAERGYDSVVKVLLDAGALPDGRGFVPATPLMLAAKAGKVGAVELLLARGADVSLISGSGWSALLFAAHGGNIQIIQKLLDAGAKPWVRDSRGTTALLEAAKMGRAEAVTLLLQHGANVNDQDKHKSTPLTLAAELGHDAVVAILIKAGADLNLADGDGDSPLGLARMKKRAGVEQMLVTAGAKLQPGEAEKAARRAISSAQAPGY